MTLTFDTFLWKNQLFTVYIFDKGEKMADLKHCLEELFRVAT